MRSTSVARVRQQPRTSFANKCVHSQPGVDTGPCLRPSSVPQSAEPAEPQLQPLLHLGLGYLTLGSGQRGLLGDCGVVVTDLEKDRRPDTR